MKQMTALEWLEQAIDLHLHDSLAHAKIDLHMYMYNNNPNIFQNLRILLSN